MSFLFFFSLLTSLTDSSKLHAAVLCLLDRRLDGLDRGDEFLGDAFVTPSFAGDLERAVSEAHS